MNRFYQCLLIGSTVLLSWLGMQIVHEFGHVLGAWLSGGTVAKVVLRPLTISYTALATNPHPLLTVWAGPLIGAGLPLAVWWCAAACNLPGTYLLRFFAGFCLIANGAYIGVGSLARIGDPAVMLANGAPVWQLWVFGVVTVPLGLWLWHGLGKDFALGKTARKIHPVAACVILLLLIFTIAIEWALGR
jgi:hypothetical protein